MRSTWVRTIRRQQYRFSCSSSSASLTAQTHPSLIHSKSRSLGRVGQLCKRKSNKRNAPLALVLREQLKVGVPFVTDDLSAREAANWNNLEVQALRAGERAAEMDKGRDTHHVGTVLVLLERVDCKAEKFEIIGRRTGLAVWPRRRDLGDRVRGPTHLTVLSCSNLL